MLSLSQVNCRILDRWLGTMILGLAGNEEAQWKGFNAKPRNQLRTAQIQSVLTSFPDCTRVLAIYYEKRMIAAGIALWFRDVLEIPWASSVGKYKALSPNNMLYWEAIKFALNNGFKKFDFGRSTPNEGTFNFKKQWGALPVQLYWQYLLHEGRTIPHLSPSNPKYRAAIRVWKNLPVSLTRLLGPLIVQNIPDLSIRKCLNIIS